MRKQFVYSGSQRIALEVSGAPVRVPLHPFGRFTGNGFNLVFDDRSLASVRAQLAEKGTPWPLDYHHATLKVQQNQADRAPRAASITDVMVEDGFVYGISEDWTATAAQEVAAGDYIYISSVLYYQTEPGPDEGLVLGYHSHALTNDPGTQNQRRIGLEQSEESGGRMNEWLLKLLGLGADATEDQARVALEAVTAKRDLADVVMTALELKDASSTPEVRGRVMKLAALEGIADDLAKATAALESQHSQNNASEIETVLKTALDDGRIFAPEVGNWRPRLERDLAGGRLALESMPKRVPTSPVIVDSSTATAALEADQAAINNLLGVSAEAFSKYGGN